jgi:hypothetical protein
VSVEKVAVIGVPVAGLALASIIGEGFVHRLR